MLYSIDGTASEMTTVLVVLTDVSRSKTGRGTSRCKLSQCLGLFSLWFRAIMNQASILGKNRAIQPLLSNGTFLHRPVTPSRIRKNLVLGQISVQLIPGEKDTMVAHPSTQRSVRKDGRVLPCAQLAQAAKTLKRRLEITALLRKFWFAAILVGVLDWDCLLGLGNFFHWQWIPCCSVYKVFH